MHPPSNTLTDATELLEEPGLHFTTGWAAEVMERLLAEHKTPRTYNTPEIIDYVVRYHGGCRDCADEDGVCPRDGIACGRRRKAAEFVLEALSYGLKHGFIQPSSETAS